VRSRQADAAVDFTPFKEPVMRSRPRHLAPALRRSVSFLMLTALAAACLTGAANAASDVQSARVEIEVETVDFDGPNTFLSEECGFAIQEQITGTLRHTTIFDAEGHPLIHHHAFIDFHIIWTNLDTGTSVSTVSPAGEHLLGDPDTGVVILSLTGLLFHVSEPGDGTLVLDAGRTLLRLFLDSDRNVIGAELIRETGVHTGLVPGLCTALSG